MVKWWDKPRWQSELWKAGTGLAVPVTFIAGGFALRPFFWGYFHPGFVTSMIIAIVALAGIIVSFVYAFKLLKHPDWRETAIDVLTNAALLTVLSFPLGLLLATFGDPG